MSAENKTVRSITGLQTTAGPAEESMGLVVDGAAPATSVAVPSGSSVVISDFIGGSDTNPVLWRIQQDNGSGFFDIALFEGVSALSSADPIYSYSVGLVINGGPTTLFRVRVQTPNAGGGIGVHCTLRSYTEP